MTPINLEMIKQLLQEFVDKEAVTAEEINVVQQQVQELEARIPRCREKLQLISSDKAKLLSMAQRYTAQTLLSSQTHVHATQALAQENKFASPSHVPIAPPSSNPMPPPREAPLSPPREEQVQTNKDPLAPQGQNKRSSATITGDHPAVPAPTPTSLNFQASQNPASVQTERARTPDIAGLAFSETAQPQPEQSQAAYQSEQMQSA